MGSVSQNPSIVLSSVVPCYNEEDGLDELMRRLTAACEKVAGDNFEIVLVDDGSTDSTREQLRAMHDEDDRVTVVLLSRNYGHQLALTAGLSVARGERIFVLDADLQDPPELLGPMMARMDDDYDVVYGSRSSRKGESAFKIHSARLFYRVLRRMVEIDIPLDTGDFRLMSRRVADALQVMPERQRFVRGMISWVGFRQSAFEYDRDERFAGETKYPLRKMVFFSLDAITSFSVLPLRLATLFGFLVASAGLLYGVWIVLAVLLGMTVPGWASTTLLLLVVGGVQLVFLGILGEYIGRIYVEVKARPLFFIDALLRKENQQFQAKKQPGSVQDG